MEMVWHFVNGIRGAVNNHKTNLMFKCKDGDKICTGLVSQEQLLDMISVKTIKNVLPCTAEIKIEPGLRSKLTMDDKMNFAII